jgi:molecular chaperone DnaK (HSP70)
MFITVCLVSLSLAGFRAFLSKFNKSPKTTIVSGSLGVKTRGRSMVKIIRRNTTVPIKRSNFFSLFQDNPTSIQIHVLQGEREFATDNKSLGYF